MNTHPDITPKSASVSSGVRNTPVVADALAVVLSDTYRLLLKTHAYHWNVEGPLFYSIHHLTEEQYQDLFQATDELAERIRALGHYAPMKIEDIIGAGRVKEASTSPSAIEMVKELADEHEKIAHRLHALIKLAEDENNDPITADLAVARSTFHEKAAWMLRATAKT